MAMTIEEARQDIPEFDTFRNICCNNCTANDWYCPSDCEMLTKGREIGYERILKAYARNDGDISKVCRYIKYNARV